MGVEFLVTLCEKCKEWDGGIVCEHNLCVQCCDCNVPFGEEARRLQDLVERRFAQQQAGAATDLNQIARQ